MTAIHQTVARPASLSNPATAIFAVLGLIVGTITALVLVHQKSRRLA